MTEDAKTVIPDEISSQLTRWKLLYISSNTIHYVVGIAGVAASGLAASGIVGYEKHLATLSGICIAILGFAQPDRKYIKFSKAWRILNMASVRYRYGLLELSGLFAAYEKSETAIAALENDDDLGTSKTTLSPPKVDPAPTT